MTFTELRIGQVFRLESSGPYMRVAQPPEAREHPAGQGWRNAVDLTIGHVIGVDPNCEVFPVELDLKIGRQRH